MDIGLAVICTGLKALCVFCGMFRFCVHVCMLSEGEENHPVLNFIPKLS